MKEKQSTLMVLGVNSAKLPILPDLMNGLSAIPIQIPASSFLDGPTYPEVHKERLKQHRHHHHKKHKTQDSAQEEKCWRTRHA